MAREKFSDPLDHMLPTEAVGKGYGLTWYNPAFEGRDPNILFHRNIEVYRWEYDPTMGEVWGKIKELECV